jgi:hypothetical protein
MAPQCVKSDSSELVTKSTACLVMTVCGRSDESTISYNSSTPSSLFQSNCLPWYYKKLALLKIREMGKRQRISKQCDMNILPSHLGRRNQTSRKEISLRGAIPRIIRLAESRQQSLNLSHLPTEGRNNKIDDSTSSTCGVHFQHHQFESREDRRKRIRPFFPEWCKLNIKHQSRRGKSSICTRDTALESKTDESIGQTRNHRALRKQVDKGETTLWHSKYNPFHRQQQKREWFVRQSEDLQQPIAAGCALEMVFFDKETREFLCVKVSIPGGQPPYRTLTTF